MDIDPLYLDAESMDIDPLYLDTDSVDMDVDPLYLDTDSVDMDIDPLYTDTNSVDIDIDPVDMDIDSVVRDYERYIGVEDYERCIGVEDYGRLISFNAFLSRFCSSQYMTPAGNQYPLDVCVSYALTAALGALAGLTYDIQNAPEFSTQEMVDCLPIKHGGVSYREGYDYVLRNGLHMKEVYPNLHTYGSPCRCPDLQGLPKYSFGDYTIFDPASTRFCLDSHPLTATIQVYGSFVRHTTQFVSTNDLMGVYSPSEGEVPLRNEKREIVSHAILVIGYGIENGKFFYIIKNLWGVEWGVNGYARVADHLLSCLAWPNSFREIPPHGEAGHQFI